MKPLNLTHNSGFITSLLLFLVFAVWLLIDTTNFRLKNNLISLVIQSGVLIYFGYSLWKYRIIKFDETSLFIQSYFLTKNIEIIPLENILEFKSTNAHFRTLLFEYRIVYFDGFANKSIKTSISLKNSPAIEALKKYLLEKNPKVAEML